MELIESFNAVKSFLIGGGHRPQIGTTLSVQFVINSKKGRQEFNDDLEIECHPLADNVAYVLHSDAFKSYEIPRPVWSSYHLISWNEQLEQLNVTIGGVEFTISEKP